MCRWSYGNVFRAPHHNSCFEPLVLGLFSMCQMCKSRAKSPSSCSKQGKYLSSALQGNLLVTLSTSSKRKHGRNREVIKNPNITFSAFPSRVLFKSKSSELYTKHPSSRWCPQVGGSRSPKLIPSCKKGELTPRVPSLSRDAELRGSDF